jgi:O-methyltransferase
MASGWLAASLSEVEENFRRYGLLDERVRFLPGWFRDTLPDAPIERLSILRLDGDFYESTFIALESLYDKVSPGGFILVDDYRSWMNCKLAVDDFRSDRGITEPLTFTDEHEAWWRKPA